MKVPDVPRGFGRARLLGGSVLAGVLVVAVVAAVLALGREPRPAPVDRPDADRTAGAGAPTSSTTASPTPDPDATDPPPADGTPVRRAVVVGTLNALGAGHPSDRDWRDRTRALAGLLRRHRLGTPGHGLSVIGLQEFTPRQARVLRRELDRRAMAVTIVSGGWDRAILVDRRVWRVRRRGTLRLPYGPGATRPNPAAILVHRATDRTVAATSVHLPALPRLQQPALMRDRRATGLDLIARRAAQWHDRGHTVLVLGDFNQRTVPATVRDSLRTGWGGPTTPIIDWVLGSRDGWEWQRERLDRETRRRGLSDHLLVLQTLRLP